MPRQHDVELTIFGVTNKVVSMIIHGEKIVAVGQEFDFDLFSKLRRHFLLKQEETSNAAVMITVKIDSIASGETRFNQTFPVKLIGGLLRYTEDDVVKQFNFGNKIEDQLALPYWQLSFEKLDLPILPTQERLIHEQSNR
ncbi:MAG TPA: hypothetical protein VNX68_17575 [Nitrosopumilaceae archaeon]|jgi:hypothetical protein|nr:hypothetical protein [Nitrosopumilaceae archaeon]